MLPSWLPSLMLGPCAASRPSTFLALWLRFRPGTHREPVPTSQRPIVWRRHQSCQQLLYCQQTVMQCLHVATTAHSTITLEARALLLLNIYDSLQCLCRIY